METWQYIVVAIAVAVAVAGFVAKKMRKPE